MKREKSLKSVFKSSVREKDDNDDADNQHERIKYQIKQKERNIISGKNDIDSAKIFITPK